MPRSGQFYINGHANLTCGPGASGDIGYVIELGHLTEFVQFIYHKIKDTNFAYTGMFIEKAFENFTAMLMKWMLTEIKQAESGMADWWINFVPRLVDLYRREQIAMQTANNILKHPDILKFTLPEVKARLLLLLGDYYWENSTLQMAKLVVLSYLQSQGDYLNVLQHLTLTPGVYLNTEAGYEKLKSILGITDVAAMRMMKGFNLQTLPSSDSLPNKAVRNSAVTPLATLDEIRNAYYNSAVSLMPSHFIAWEG